MSCEGAIHWPGEANAVSISGTPVLFLTGAVLDRTPRNGIWPCLDRHATENLTRFVALGTAR
jgi:hypothetical protein